MQKRLKGISGLNSRLYLIKVFCISFSNFHKNVNLIWNQCKGIPCSLEHLKSKVLAYEVWWTTPSSLFCNLETLLQLWRTCCGGQIPRIKNTNYGPVWWTNKKMGKGMTTTIFISLFFSASCPVFYGVANGKLYNVYPQPQFPKDHWIGSVTELGSTGWNDFKFLFFHPDGTLYGVLNGRFYKGTIREGASSTEWIAQATLIGTGDWDGFQFLFFDPKGVLYGVYDDRFYKRHPPTAGNDNWLGSATMVGSGGWSVFQFLFFDPQGILYGVVDGRFHKRGPPEYASDGWLQSSTLVGSTGWSDFQFLFFTADGELYGVNQDNLYELSQRDDWLASSTLIGTNGWSEFKFLMTDWLES